MEWEHVLRHRSYVFHFTREENLPFLRARQAMYSAKEIVRQAIAFEPQQIPSPENFLRRPRKSAVTFMLGPGRSDRVTLNDQKPISDGQIGNIFDDGWNREKYTAFLNGHVFFYGGREYRPDGKACGAFADKYSSFVLLRCPVESFRKANPNMVWLLTAHNTGGGQARGRVKRGPSLFASLEEFRGTVQDIAEVVFRGSVVLPAGTQTKPPSVREWQPL